MRLQVGGAPLDKLSVVVPTITANAFVHIPHCSRVVSEADLFHFRFSLGERFMRPVVQ